MDPNQLLLVLQQHGWRAFAFAALSIVIGGIGRALKADVPLVWNVPARWRPVVIAGLGVFGSVLDLLVAGDSVTTAFQFGMSAALVAMLGHTFGIEVMRGGKELPFPGATKVEQRGFALVHLLALLALGGLVTLAGCAWLKKEANTPGGRTIRMLAEESCRLFADSQAKKAGISPAEVFQAACGTEAMLKPWIDEQLAGQERAGARFAAAHPALEANPYGDAGSLPAAR